MPATSIIGQSISRRGWGVILLAAAFLALAAAAVLEALGLGSGDLGPLSFVSAVVLVKLGLFSFWPVLAAKGAEASTSINATLRRGAAALPVKSLSLRPLTSEFDSERDLRIDGVCFAANIPTFVVTADGRILDWNKAFDLVFAQCVGLSRGAAIAVFYQHLDNFRRVAKRPRRPDVDPMAALVSQERVCFLSPDFGRMVFTRLMTPLIDPESGAVLGWNIALNINSVTRREAFFEQLFAAIAAEALTTRQLLAMDKLCMASDPYRRLMERHAQDLRSAYRVLEIGAGTGNLSQILLDRGHKLTAVDGSTHRLRRLRAKCRPFARRLRIVKKAPQALKDLPPAAFDGAVMMLALDQLSSPSEVFSNIFRALVPGGTLSVSFLQPQSGSPGLCGVLRRSLEESEQGRIAWRLHHQLAKDYESERAREGLSCAHAPADIRKALLDAGFQVASDAPALDGHGMVLVGKR